jgi:hypothetical protein
MTFSLSTSVTKFTLTNTDEINMLKYWDLDRLPSLFFLSSAVSFLRNCCTFFTFWEQTIHTFRMLVKRQIAFPFIAGGAAFAFTATGGINVLKHTYLHKLHSEPDHKASLHRWAAV